MSGLSPCAMGETMGANRGMASVAGLLLNDMSMLPWRLTLSAGGGALRGGADFWVAASGRFASLFLAAVGFWQWQ